MSGMYLGLFGWTCTFVKLSDCVIAARGDALPRVTAVSQPVATSFCLGNPSILALEQWGTCCNFCNFVRASQQLLRSTARWIARRGAQQLLEPGQDPWQPCAHLHRPAFGLCGVCGRVQGPPPCRSTACRSMPQHGVHGVLEGALPGHMPPPVWDHLHFKL